MNLSRVAPERRAMIVGIGETRYTKRGQQADRGEWALACEATVKACRDAGVDPRRIEGLASFSGDSSLPWLMQHALGIQRLRFASMVWGGGGSGSCGALAHAVAAVESGQADTVLVFRSIVQRTDSRYGAAGGFSEVPQIDLLAPFGMLTPASMFAPIAMRYMHEHGIHHAHFAELALTFRENAQRNPRAVTHGQPLSLAQYMASRMIAAPFRLYDCCQESDGACAILVTTTERARDLPCKPVRVLSAQQGGDAGWGSGGMGTHTMPAAEYGAGNGHQLARDLYADAGITASDLDFAQLYDHFSPLVLMALENFGICGRGEAGDFVASGQIRPGGAMPLNTSGGLLSEAYIHGLNLVAEAVRQLRGEATTQVANAKVGLVTAGIGSTPTSAAVLAL
ncbi:MAG: hypothetical protein QM772_01800 [Ottowia sp.]|uniref:thiolase C-terminal domain-containing protein n=1 Tax=Ottowia sp. TaxID=1898956 RepID=UPI0039E29155